MNAVVAPLDCVALLLIRDRQVLVEKRKLTKALAPGAVAIPGGHVEAGEGIEQALRREAQEELAIVPETAFVCTLMHPAEELRRLHSFAVRGWEGRIEPAEAEGVLWLPVDAIGQLDFDVDKTAVGEYSRLEHEGGLAWRTKG